MRQDVIETISDAFPFRKVQIMENTKLSEIVQDSIDAVELVAVLSTTYGLRVEPADFTGMHTVADVVDYVERHTDDSRSRLQLESF